jgi:hypothetical protein
MYWRFGGVASADQRIIGRPGCTHLGEAPLTIGLLRCIIGGVLLPFAWRTARFLSPKHGSKPVRGSYGTLA